MMFAVTTKEMWFGTVDNHLISLPAGQPVVITGTDGTGADMTYMVETEHGEMNEAVTANYLDFDADF